MLNEPSISELYPESVAAAESSLVGLALVDSTQALGTGARAEDFFNPRYRQIWSAIEELSLDSPEEPVDAIVVGDILSGRGTLAAVGGIEFLTRLAISAGLPSMAGAYAELVRKGHLTRELRRLGASIGETLSNGTDPQDCISQIHSKLEALAGGASAEQVTTLAEACRVEIQRVEEFLSQEGSSRQSPGLPTGCGLESLVPGGIPRDKVSILFGETGNFKTAVKQIMMDAIARAGGTVLDFTLEDSEELTAQRYLSRHTGIPYAKISARLLDNVEDLRKADIDPAARIYVVGNVPSTIEEAIRVARGLANKVGKLDAVFCDYIQLMDIDSSHQGREAQGLYHICKQAQKAAHRDKTAWVLLSQVNNLLDQRPDKRPRLGDLYGSSGMKHTCKLAVATYRPSKHESTPSKDSPWYGVFTQHPNGREIYANALELWIRKGFGRVNQFVPLWVDAPTGRVRELTPDELPSMP